MVDAQDGAKGSLAQVMEPMVKSTMEPMVEFMVQSFMVQYVMVNPIVQSQPLLMRDDHDNICVVNESSLVKNLDGGILVEYNSLASMPHLEDSSPIINNL